MSPTLATRRICWFAPPQPTAFAIALTAAARPWRGWRRTNTLSIGALPPQQPGRARPLQDAREIRYRTCEPAYD
jgi:hypothetical protein